MTELTTALAATIAACVGIAAPGATTQNIWTAHDTTGCTWNAANVFLATVANKSCIALKQDPANTYAAHMTVISAHHAICAAHVAPPIGTTVYAYTEAGVVVSTTVSAIDQIPSSDICVITLAAALTDVQVARFLPSNFKQYVHKTDAKVYGIFATQDEKLFIGYTTGNQLALYTGVNLYFGSDAADPYYTWYQNQRVGDSSSPFFFIIDGYLVVEESASIAGGGAAYDSFSSSIQALMTTRTGETLTFISLAGYAIVNDPAVPTVVVPSLPILAAGTVTTPIDYVVGLVAGDTFADLTSAFAGPFSIVAPYRYFIRDCPVDGINQSWGSIIVNSSQFAHGSTLQILAHTSNATKLNALIQAASTSGLASMSSFLLNAATTGLTNFALSGLNVDPQSLGQNAQCKITSIGGTSSILTAFVGQLMFLTPQFTSSTQGLIDASVGSGGSFFTEDVGVANRGTISSGKYQVRVNFVGTGSGYARLAHISTALVNNVTGFLRVNVPAGNTACRLDLANIIAATTNSAFAFMGSLSMGAGGSLTINASGIRSGTVVLAGASIGLTSSDILNGMTSAVMFADTANGMTILTNASTLTVATTTPVSVDIAGNGRPQIMPWDNTARVYAGFANAAINVTTVAATCTAAVTWVAFTGATQYQVLLNGTNQGTLTSGATITIDPAIGNMITVRAQDAAGTILAQGQGQLSLLPGVIDLHPWHA